MREKNGELKVGDFVWLFDINHRVYEKAASGDLWPKGGPIYREHWRKTKIEEVTTKSYIVHGGRTKLPKNGDYITTEKELDQDVFIHDNAHKIAQRVRDCRDYFILKSIEELLN